MTTHNLVCVTGAGGYIGSHLVRELLERGYRVRGTVRNKNDQTKNAHLWKFDGAKERLELFSADLLNENSFDEAFRGCSAIFHSASAVVFNAKDPQKEIVDVAVNGTKNVFQTITRVEGIKKVILTSSIAAVASVNRPLGYNFTEGDWNDDANLKENPYELSKTLAERFAWEFVEKLPTEKKFQLVAINPSFVIGPVYNEIHTRSSPTIFRDLLKRTFPACPNFHFGFVDIRDVATAHVNALENDYAQGRYICHNKPASIVEAAAIIAPHFPNFRVPTKRLPDFVLYMIAPFDKRMSFSMLRNYLGKTRHFSNERIQNDLGIKFRPLDQSFVDTCQSMVDLGMVQPSQA